MVDLSIVTISHGHDREIRKLLKSIREIEWNVSFEVIMIDNLRPYRAAKIARKIFPGIRIIKNVRPHGYAYNANIGIKHSKGKFVLLLNPDIIVLDGLLDMAVDFMENHPDVGIAAPMLFNRDGSIQASARKFPDLPVALFRAFGMDKIFKDFGLNKKYEQRDILNTEKCTTVDWVSGAAMVIRKRAIEEIGFFDSTNFYLYFEDVDVCYRMWNAGWRVMYVPKLKVIHEWKRQSAKNFLSIHRYYHIISGIKFFKKYGLKLKNPREG